MNTKEIKNLTEMLENQLKATKALLELVNTQMTTSSYKAPTVMAGRVTEDPPEEEAPVKRTSYKVRLGSAASSRLRRTWDKARKYDELMARQRTEEAAQQPQDES